MSDGRIYNAFSLLRENRPDCACLVREAVLEHQPEANILENLMGGYMRPLQFSEDTAIRELAQINNEIKQRTRDGASVTSLIRKRDSLLAMKQMAAEQRS